MSYSKYEYCGYCRYCNCDDVSLNKNGQYPCERERIWVYANARPKKNNCFWQVVSYNLSGRDSAIKLSKGYNGFYITTAIYKKLSIDSDELNKLYLFRHTYLENSIIGKEFLRDYDIFAPRIAKLIELTDEVNARELYEFYIKGVLEYIKQDDLVNAGELYISMYERLKEKFIYPYLNLEQRKSYIIKKPISSNIQ